MPTTKDYVVNSDELLATHFDPLPFAMTPWLLRQSINMIYGWRGTGKTFFAMQCAVAIASGKPFLRWACPEPLRVLYIDGEMGLRALKARLEGMGERPAEDRLGFLSLEKCSDGVIWNLADPKYQQSYNVVCQNYDVIFIDNIAMCCRLSGRDMEAQAWERVQSWALKMRSAGKAIVFVHHAGKNGDQRGTSTREDPMNQVIKLAKTSLCAPDKTQFEVSFGKGRDIYGDDRESLLATISQSSSKFVWTWEKLQTEKRTKIFELKSSGCSVRDIADALGIPAAEIRQIIANLNFNEQTNDRQSHSDRGTEESDNHSEVIF